MLAIDIIQRPTSFVVAHIPFIVFVALSILLSVAVYSGVFAGSAISESTTLGATTSPIDNIEEDEGFIVIGVAPLGCSLSASSRATLRHPHTPEEQQPSASAADTAIITDDAYAAPPVPQVPKALASSLSTSCSYMNLSQFLAAHNDDVSFDESIASSDEEDDGLGSSDESDAVSVCTSEDTEPEEFECTELHPDSDVYLDGGDDNDDSNPNEQDGESPKDVVEPSLPVFVASAIPQRVYEVLRFEKECKRVSKPLKFSPQSIDDIDDVADYKVEWLTPRAVFDAQKRSREINRIARMRALAISKGVLKSHEYPKFISRRRPAELKDLCHSSPLRRSYNLHDVEEEVKQEEAEFQRFWDEEVF